ncbi:MAG: hypothetical protein JST67_00140 [Bacteroidetes bacterium]|nr:hypothetical protein [Bacteroidota bacterium]
MNTEKIELRKVRDIGSLFNDSISFLKTNYRSFFGINLFLAGPFILFTGLLMGYLQFISTAMARISVLEKNFAFLPESSSTVFLLTLIFVLTIVVSSTCVYLYFSVYDTTAAAQLPITRHQISALLTKASFRLFRNLIILLFLISILSGVLMGGTAVLFDQSMSSGVFFVGILIAAYFVFFPILLYLMVVACFLVIRDKIRITSALKKTIKYMRGHFWSTWLFMICAVVSLTMLYFVFQMPYYILLALAPFVKNGTDFFTSYSIWYVLFGALAMMGVLLVINPIFTCFCVFNFYSQEEKHEGNSLLHRIENIEI